MPLTLEYLDPRALTPQERNPWAHPPEQAEGLAAAIDQAGWAGAAVLNRATGRIIDGHLRREEAIRRGELLPTLVGEWTEAQERLLLRTINPLAQLAEQNAELLAALDAELAADFDAGALVPDARLAAICAEVNGHRPALLTDPDEIPTQVEARCKPGDLWRLGDHRLLCGDATSAEDVARLMGGERAALCLTDPPYGVGWDYESGEDTRENLAALVAGFIPVARPISDVMLITVSNRNQHLYPTPDWTLCWFIAAGTGSNPWGFTCWHPVFAYGKCTYLARGLGGRPDGMAITGASPETGHPCAKPVGVWSKFMERGSTAEGDLVFDPFLGSGTTMIAAEQLARTCYGMEIEPKYVDIALARWEAATGRTAERLA